MKTKSSSRKQGARSKEQAAGSKQREVESRKQDAGSRKQKHKRKHQQEAGRRNIIICRGEGRDLSDVEQVSYEH